MLASLIDRWDAPDISVEDKTVSDVLERPDSRTGQFLKPLLTG